MAFDLVIYSINSCLQFLWRHWWMASSCICLNCILFSYESSFFELKRSATSANVLLFLLFSFICQCRSLYLVYDSTLSHLEIITALTLFYFLWIIVKLWHGLRSMCAWLVLCFWMDVMMWVAFLFDKVCERSSTFMVGLVWDLACFRFTCRA